MYTREALEYVRDILSSIPPNTTNRIDRLIRDHIAAVYHAYKQYGVFNRARELGIDARDLMQEGVISLIKAAENYKKEKGGKFIVFLTSAAVYNARRYIQYKGTMQATLTYSPRNSSNKKVFLEGSYLDENSSYDEPATLAEVLEDHREERIGEKDERDYLVETVRKAVMSLPIREKAVVMIRDGIYSDRDGERAPKLKDIARCMDVSPERVRQIRVRAMKRLKDKKKLIELIKI